ncbi:hypothetical protein HSBAA_48350 [Vreelandella sulfidaeris]|uniref:Uncharacterized protein n=1 Tax=Vreelandella sulfidaeris TaxID=115553 RepID=A0A455UH39_9GAMM|nr:hypothetical protein HSBAA_48350 [Halomonas sulfidaeris]
MVLLPVAYAGNVHRLLEMSIYDVQLLVLVLILSLSAGFLIMAERARNSWLEAANLVCAAVIFCVGFYVALFTHQYRWRHLIFRTG